ncbi:mannose-6-phosphate isomerase [Gloeophyllum trabeum ATCC 11539]|uniref:Mannose-6-phosphate isomerase n=1 Tax=Gloeophyllum trabeum (strain ATCC 11539 / FP-39264 / Madison 617) TaxID=670483 RepID=S7Q833_GLOTA|nr:mannose-6-phosphate isomerase [Gloeophyllum trabeum ATCC 11539]EPQ55687.1 mannose-6-phosphate isomerase [Gloeophyllum trabeum ATCC 11539]
MTSKNVFRLKTSYQTYDWGKQGSSALVAKLAPNSVGPDFKLDENTTYAETWMGTHPNGPASIYDTSQSLKSLIDANPAHFLGSAYKKWPRTTDIPFLFKILCAGKALPLQAHPDKALAEELHRQDQGKGEFVDANHKPEIAVAIGDPLDEAWGEGVVFLGFVGFRPLDEIRGFLEDVPELRQAIGDEGVVKSFLENPSKETLKRVYVQLLTRGKDDPEGVKKDVEMLVARTQGGAAQLGEAGKLVLKTHEQYPGDVGVLATSFFMNLVKLKRGEAVFCDADTVHAWLEGGVKIIECMAVSDNVLNSAFVPPPERDVRTFVNMLTYAYRPPSGWFLPRKPYERSKNGKTEKFAPPLDEFAVLWTSLGKDVVGEGEVLGASPGPTIGIVTKAGTKTGDLASGEGRVRFQVKGESEEVPVGGVVFVAPGNEVAVSMVGAEGEAEVWWSTCLVEA